MKLKILIVFLFFTLGSSIVSCFYAPCEPVPSHFEIVGIKSYNMKFTNTGSNPWETIDEDERIRWNRFFIRFWFEVNYIADLRHNFGGTLQARDCEESGWAGGKIGVDTIIVRTVFDYNENYAAGTVINDIILTNGWTSRPDDFKNFSPLENYLLENSDGVRRKNFEIKLTEPPSDVNRASFDILYKLKNGDEFHHRTIPVFIEM